MSNNNLPTYIGLSIITLIGGIIGYKYDIFSDSKNDENDENENETKKKENDEINDEIEENDDKYFKKSRKKTLKKRSFPKRKSSSFSY